MSSRAELQRHKTRVPTQPELQKRKSPAPTAVPKRPKSGKTQAAETVGEHRHDLHQAQAAEAAARGSQLARAYTGHMGAHAGGWKPGVKQDAPWSFFMLRDSGLKAEVSELVSKVLAEGFEVHKKQDTQGARSGACGKSIAASQQTRVIDALVSSDSVFLTSKFAQVPELVEKERLLVASRVASGRTWRTSLPLDSARLGDRRLCDCVADYLRSRTPEQFVSTMRYLAGDFDIMLCNESES